MSISDFDLTKEAPFDPGYSASVARVSGNVEYIYAAFCSLPNSKQKRFQFSVLYPKLLRTLDLNISFYLGCLLWGVCLKSLKEVPVVQNPCLGGVFDDECYHEIDFLIDFLTSTFGRDVKYYMNKTYVPNSQYITILETYREFLKLNEAFVNTKLTSDILLPKNLKIPDSVGITEIFTVIKSSVETDNLQELLTLADKVL